MIQARRVHVAGLVQGIGFRWATMSEARRLGVLGWVRNTRNGGVEVFAQGEGGTIEAFIEWLGAGPIGASVRELLVEEAAPKASLEGFDIRG